MQASRVLGRTALRVSPLGLGAGPLGDPALGEVDAERLIRGALELGVALIDTAPSYGLSEARIGRVLASMGGAARDRVVVVTKGGYGVPGVADWTPEVLERGVDQALRVLAVDRVDVFLLHSCPRERLERGDLLRGLERIRSAGKARAVGYSGDGDALRWAIACDVFDVVECSVNLVDQEALANALPDAIRRGRGVLAKRALGGAPWAAGTASPYVDRWKTAFADPLGEDREGALSPDEIAIRFAAHAPGVATALLGTRDLGRVRAAVEQVDRGALPAPLVAEITRRFATHGASWAGVI